MKNGISLNAVGQATSLMLALTFALCVLWGLLFPNYAMYPSWRTLLPGFEWLSWPSFGLGLLESYAYGWFFAIVWVPIYNVFARRTPRQTGSDGTCCQDSGKHTHGHA